MNELALIGRNHTIRVFASILLISIYSIVTSNIAADSIESNKIVQQIVRFGLTVMLMYFIFKGKKWAAIVLSVLCVLAVILAVISLFLPVPLPAKIPMVVMIFIYSMTVYHLNFSNSFKEYFHYLKTKS